MQNNVLCSIGFLSSHVPIYYFNIAFRTNGYINIYCAAYNVKHVLGSERGILDSSQLFELCLEKRHNAQTASLYTCMAF